MRAFRARGRRQTCAASAAACAAFVLALCVPGACGVGPATAGRPRAALSLEQLMDIETTAGKKTADPGRRPGGRVCDFWRGHPARRVPELFPTRCGQRRACKLRDQRQPVGHFDPWVQRPVSNKLLVLVDGRVVYTPTFGGVFWDVQDLLLEDVERIEVIRGPGGTLWGENAVNGVINVITKTAGETRGTFAEAGTHSMDGGFVGTRYGGGLGTTGDYRVYAKDFHRAYEAGAETTAEEWTQARGGFRLDWRAGARDTLSVQGAGYSGESLLNGRDVLLVPPFSSTVEHTWDEWTAGTSRPSGHGVTTGMPNCGCRRTWNGRRAAVRTSPNGVHEQPTLDLQHHVRPSGRHDLVWGAAYARSADRLNGSFRLSFVPTEDSFVVGSGFVQDDITLVPDRLRVVAGTKVLHNTYTGWEQQPNARVLWTPNQDRSIWLAVSRAVRLPT